MYRILLFVALLILPLAAIGETIITDSTTDSTINSNTNSRITSPPPSAIAPAFLTSNTDLCSIGTSASIQTQVFGVAGGTVFTEPECVLIKRAKLLWSMKMFVASIALLCSAPDGAIFEALERSGTPCPINGLIGAEAQAYWDANPHLKPNYKGNPKTKEWSKDDKTTTAGVAGISALFLMLLFLI